jgi:hypothetical protein
MLLGNSNLWLNLREIQINNFNYSLQKIDYTLSFFLNAIAFSYHQGKRTVNLTREFWDILYMTTDTNCQKIIDNLLLGKIIT